MTTQAETIFHNGTIHTLDPHTPTAEAMAVAGGRVIAIGMLEAVEATAHSNTKRIDLAGRTIIPGFNDANVGLADNQNIENSLFPSAKFYVRFGITNITESGISPEQLEMYRLIADERRLPLRINAVALRYDEQGNKVPLPERSETNWLRIDTIRLAVEDNEGNVRVSDDQMRAMVWDIHRAGLRAALFAASQTAIEQAIGAIEYASKRLVSRIKHRIEPFTNPSDSQIRRCHEHGINVVVHPSWPEELLQKLLDNRVNVAFGSMAKTPQETNPLVHIRSALTSGGLGNGLGSKKLDMASMLKIYTVGGAIIAGEDHVKGSLIPGKYADFAVLSGNPLRAPIERLTDLQVEMTYVNGLPVFTAAS